MSIDHGKLLALASEIQSAVGHAIEPDVQHVPVTWLLDWAERLRALAQPAEAVEDMGPELHVALALLSAQARERGAIGEAVVFQTAERILAERAFPNNDIHQPQIIAVPHCEVCLRSLEVCGEPLCPGKFKSRLTSARGDGGTDAAQGAVAPFAYGADLTPGDYDMEHSVWLLRPGESVPAGCTPLYTHPQAAPAQGDGVSLIAAERRRQIEAEGWTPEHDDEHAAGELSRAAGCYALAYALHQLGESREAVPAPWPWDHEWWKPTWDARQLVKAGALIAAEIDRLQRPAAPSPETRS